MNIQASNPTSVYVDRAFSTQTISHAIPGPTILSNGTLASATQGDVEKPMPKLPPQATGSTLEKTAINRPTHRRNISSNILPSLSIDNSTDSQIATAPYLSAGGETVVSGRRRAPTAGTVTGLPTRPRLAISGPIAPPQDGKRDQAPSAFERPRPPPLILQMANGKTPRNGGSLG